MSAHVEDRKIDKIRGDEVGHEPKGNAVDGVAEGTACEHAEPHNLKAREQGRTPQIGRAANHHNKGKQREERAEPRREPKGDTRVLDIDKREHPGNDRHIGTTASAARAATLVS